MSIFAKCNTVRYIRKKAQEVLLRLIFTAFLRINSCHFSILKHLVYGGPNGELGASLRYLSQRYTMPDEVTKGLLTDIGLSAMILLLYAKIGKAYCFQYALPFSLYHFKA